MRYRARCLVIVTAASLLAAPAGVGLAADTDGLANAYATARGRVADQKKAWQDAQGRAAARDAKLIQVVIYETNDIHGHIAPTPPDPARPGDHGSGGAASLATLLKRETRPYLWIDSGDVFQGTPEGNLTKGDAVMAVFNRLKLTAMELGNHDYDYGEANVRRLAASASFPFLGANITSIQSQSAAGYVKPYIIRDMGAHVRIGIFGLLTQSMDTLEFADNIKGLRFDSTVAAARKAVDALRRKGAGVIIAATHQGIEEYDGKSTGIGHGDIDLAKNAPGIDLILGGHTHTAMTRPLMISDGGRRTMITQTGGMLASVYRIVLSIDPETGALDHEDGELIALDPQVYPPDPDMAREIDAVEAALAKRMDRPIGSAAESMPFPASGSSVGELAIGDWIADDLRKAGGAEIGLINTYGIRGGLPQGPLTYGDVYRVLPFENRLATLKLSGADLKAIVENSLSADKVYFQYSGLTIVYDPAASDGARLKSLAVDGVPVDDARLYSVATMDFVATVSRSFQTVRKVDLVISPRLVRDLLSLDIERNSPLPLPAAGRIRTRSSSGRLGE